MSDQMTQVLVYAIENNMLTMSQAFEVIREVSNMDKIATG